MTDRATIAPHRGRLVRGITGTLLLAALLGSSGCIAFPRMATFRETRGQVLAESDRRPMPNALVEALWSADITVQSHGSTRFLGSDYRFADNDGRFAFPRRVFWLIHYIGLAPMMWTSVDDVSLSVLAAPPYLGCVQQPTPEGDVEILVQLDGMQTGAVTWPLTPRNVAKRYLAIYEGCAQRANGLLNEPQAARHPQYRQLLEYRDAMERKAAEWRERLEHAADEPVLDRPPPP